MTAALSAIVFALLRLPFVMIERFGVLKQELMMRLGGKGTSRDEDATPVHFAVRSEISSHKRIKLSQKPANDDDDENDARLRWISDRDRKAALASYEPLLQLLSAATIQIEKCAIAAPPTESAPVLAALRSVVAEWAYRCRESDYWLDRSDSAPALIVTLVKKSEEVIRKLYSQAFLDNAKRHYPNPPDHIVWHVGQQDVRDISAVNAFLSTTSLAAILASLPGRLDFPSRLAVLVTHDLKAIRLNKPVPGLVCRYNSNSNGNWSGHVALWQWIKNVPDVLFGRAISSWRVGVLSPRPTSPRLASAVPSDAGRQGSEPIPNITNILFPAKGVTGFLTSAFRLQKKTRRSWKRLEGARQLKPVKATLARHRGLGAIMPAHADSSERSASTTNTATLASAGRLIDEIKMIATRQAVSMAATRQNSIQRGGSGARRLHDEQDRDDVLVRNINLARHSHFKDMGRGRDDKKPMAPLPPVTGSSLTMSPLDEAVLQISDELGTRLQLEDDVVAACKREEAATAVKVAKARREAEDKARRAEEEQRIRRSGGLRPPRPGRRLVERLDEQWILRGRDAARSDHRSTPYAQMPDRTELEGKDFATVVPETTWLNDEIVNGALSCLDQWINRTAGITDVKGRTRKCLTLNSFFYPNLQKNGPGKTERSMRRMGVGGDNLLAVELVLIPICQNSHWTLLAVMPSRRQLTHLDSLAGDGKAERATVRGWLQAFLGDRYRADEWDDIEVDSPRQTNSYDCGVHAVSNGICLGLGLQPAEAYAAEDMPLQRLRIAAALLNGGFSDELDLAGL